MLAGGDEQAQEILSALLTELTDEGVPGKTERGTVYGVQSVYTRMMGISGPILVDSYHVGQTFFNDYGRPHETGFNNVTGFSTLNEQGPWSLYVRGEYQHAPSAAGYTQALAQQVSLMDEIVFAPPNDPEATVQAGPIAAANPFRLVEATLSVHILGHEISGGKSDAWLGPGMGSAMPWSNNAENIYSFRINRVEPMNIKYLSRWLGPVRYDFFYGSLKGHTDPNDDWVHSDMFSVPADDELPVRLPADSDLRRQGTRAGDDPDVSERIFRHQRYERRGEGFAGRSGSAVFVVPLQLPAAVRAKKSDAVCGLGGA